LFFIDKAKAMAVGAVIMFPLVALGIKLTDWTGPMCYLYLWIMSLVVSVLMSFIFPTFIMPLFNKFKPLEDQQLKAKIEALAGRMGFPLTKVFESDGSKRS